MFRYPYHPKAFLTNKKNVHRGLVNRTKILLCIRESPYAARAIAEKTGLNYKTVLHHLHLLEVEHIITRTNNKPSVWSPTGAGQQTLLEG